jgi:hypothetical protein
VPAGEVGRLSTWGSRSTLHEAKLGATVPHEMPGLEVVICNSGEHEAHNHRHDERFQEMQSELDSLTAPLSSSTPSG